MEHFRFRLNCIDHYQAAPTELDPQLHRGSGLPSQRHNAYQVPVIRVFGATETGQKVCAHIHGALPYLYLEYKGSLKQTEVDTYIHSLRISIDHALAVSYRRNAYDGKSIFVGHISLVKGVPFYGYQVGYRFYLKVYLLNPMHMTRFADLLHQGAILAKVIQPYESHMQYLAQWMCDYSLYGCAYIDCAKVKFRAPVPDYLEMNSLLHKWHGRTIRPEWISSEDAFPRQSHCSIEVDICVQDILNRKEVQARPLHHDFLERFSHLAPDEKLVQSMAGLWRDETIRRKRRMGIKDPSSSPFPPEVLVSMSADPRNTEKGGWIHEEEFREMVQGLIEAERDQIGDQEIGFDRFVKPDPMEEHIQTALESVEDLYPRNLEIFHATQMPLPPEDGDAAYNDALIDEDSILHLDGDDSAEPNSDPINSKQDHVTDVKSLKSGELRTGSDDYVKQFRDPEDPMEPVVADDRLNDESEDEFGSFPNDDIFAEQIEGRGEKRSSPTPDWHLRKRQKVFESGHLDTAVPGRRKSSLATSSPVKSDQSPRKVAFEDHVSQRLHDGFSSQPVQSTPSLSQGSIKAQGNRGPSTLSFPVVKHPHDPDTTLRLSQRSGFSNSQKSPKTPVKSMSLQQMKDSPTTPWSAAKTSSTDSSPRKSISSRALQMAEQLPTSFEIPVSSKVYCLGHLPPSAEVVEATLLDYGVPPEIYQDAYYSDEKDVPDRPREYAGREFKLESNTLPYLPAFDPTGTSAATVGEKPGIVIDKAKEELEHRSRRSRCSLRNWEIAKAPPTAAEVEQWLHSSEKFEKAGDNFEIDVSSVAENQRVHKPKAALSQIDGPTQKNKHGFKFSQKQKSTSVKHETQYMSTMSLEVHVNTRGTLVPDPAQDEIACIFWCIQAGDDDAETGEGLRVGVLALSDESGVATQIARQVTVEVEHENDELDLINRMVDIVRDFDPDILTGYEVHNSSWGYLIERARTKYEYDLCDEFSRMKSQSHGRFGKEADRWGFTHTSTIRVTGRHMINIWRAMRGELNLLQYTMENVVFHLLHKRIPHYPHQDLTRWYQSNKPRDLARVLNHFLSRVQINLEILEANELTARTSEQARLLGVDFFSVFSRGSQFKVESLMFRIAKPENFMIISPSRKQVGQQNALECLPLVMEPQSAFYNSPLLVLDFQSLYPSVMIAYNYCYSTYLGRIVSWRGQNKMGFTDFKREPGLLELVKDYINIAPNGIMYVKPEMRKSLLAKMLGEILETRVMVKSGMKVDKDDKNLQQLLNNRQLALKLIANVTYGYTSASFSGRMPCSEIADSIVQTGRETLEKAIALIHSVERWGAEVVYGDTDSLFVYLKGRTRDQAFTIGEEIAKAVTDTNPRPIKLKFEKVYHPCVLLAKKRYVGFKYESRNQPEPDFDAKGIETVRRDGTPAEQKIEEKALKLLFRTADLSQVKQYFQRQCMRIMTGKVSIQDFLFAREVKLGTYSDKGPPPPGALIATRRMLQDHRAEPQYGERVPYVVVTGAPGARLIDRCVAPETLLLDDGVELDAEYYISKNLIPPLERIFNLVGANVRSWFDEMPKVQRVRSVNGGKAWERKDGGNAFAPGQQQQVRKTLESYMKSTACLVCRAKLSPTPVTASDEPVLPLCTSCAAQPARALLALRERQRTAEVRASNIDAVCRSCEGISAAEEVRCNSRDCPVFYTRVRERATLGSLKAGLRGVIETLEMRGDGLDW
ncbi:hypothetical protein K490DRAFT_35841 [Saccharata proteae CBS 121410]|uniref:DNA polymerase n=1 Tax=Saccharata proteae CBS 121410 TaxID=1314787 RepID=A0A9P4HZ10_9PEZI|nr:hypothetical protein K490DRAFT_35841 [Saccharata proteae CBS 121410]